VEKKGFEESRIQGVKWKRQKVRGLEGWRVGKLDKPEKPGRGLEG